MKLTFVIPSLEFLASAGARIRYLRMIPLLKEAGYELELLPIVEIDKADISSGAVVFSKCFDSRAIVAAARCRASGCLVGVDLFDDYFSQRRDSRMTMYRTWLDEMLRQVDFVLCSTDRMAEIAGSMRPGLPLHVLNDPAMDLRFDSLPSLLDEKCARAREERLIRLCWFGIGDNPYFPVGLDDVTALGARLAQLVCRGWNVELTVSTNVRALDVNRLSRLARLPFPVHVELWSEARETELLLDSVCCFLPVSAQPFSIAKSLNRAVSALSAGCQVIWAGYPLYRHFDDLIYAEPLAFLDDLESDALRLSSKRFDAYRTLMRDFASLEVECERFLGFVETLSRRADSGAGKLPVLAHGHQTNGNAHKMARKDGALSVGTPFSPSALVYDALFTAQVTGGDLRLLVAEGVLDRLLPHVRAKVRRFCKLNKMTYFAIDWHADEHQEERNLVGASLPEQLAAYSGIFARIRQKIEEAFGPIEMMISESSKLPFDPRAGKFNG